jgi:biotin carboxyl carrier protein
MKLRAEQAGQDHQLIIQPIDQGVSAAVDGRHYELEVRDLGRDEYLLIDGARLYDCRVGTGREQGNSFEVHLRGSSYEIKVVDPKRLRSTHGSRGRESGLAQIVAPMPGKVVRVLVETGVRVEAGEGLVVVEAMKMQNEMKAPKAGKVVSLPAQAGATVNAGDVLAVIE